METKKEIREKILKKRRAMEEKQWRDSSKAILAAVISHPLFEKEKNIYTYVDYNREAGTRGIIGAAFEKEKNVWVPKVLGDVIHFYRIRSLEELRPGAYGIPEPVKEPRTNAETMVTETKEEGGLMIMPGAAFDERCARIGYGGGYYDRYLAEHSRLRTLALAFELQIVPQVPQEEYDISPEFLITERRILCRQDCQKTRFSC